MANTMAYAKAYINLLDGIYKKGSCTSILEGNAGLFKQGNNANSILVKKITNDGLGDYSRASGYVAGDVQIAWEEHTFAIDRGRKYNLDAMDQLEAQTEIAEIMAEVMRKDVVPEIDAYRFAKICSLCGVDVAANLTYDTVLAAIDTGIETLDDAEVPVEDRVFFVSNNVYKLMKQSGDFFNVRLGMNKVLDREIETFDGMPIVRVPVGRFKSVISLLDGTSQGETAGGFAEGQACKDINFMIVDSRNVVGLVKHQAPKIILPEQNQAGDGSLAMVRLYHDLFILDNKKAGAYIHTKA